MVEDRLWFQRPPSRGQRTRTEGTGLEDRLPTGIVRAEGAMRGPISRQTWILAAVVALLMAVGATVLTLLWNLLWHPLA